MRNLIIIIIIFNTNIAWGQLEPVEECGTVLTPEHTEYLADTRDQRNNLNPENYISPAEVINLVAHIIVEDEDDLTNEFTEDEVDDAIEQLNDAFVPVGLHFKRCTLINYISEDDYPNDDIYPTTDYKEDILTGRTETTMIAQDHSYPNVVNVFFTPDPGGSCGLANYPSNTDRVFFMANDCALNGSTFAHEMGHYFNLSHTFDGQDENVVRPLDESSECLQNVDCDCNCDEAGDELCDTPADPQFREYSFRNSINELETTRYSITSCNTVTNCELVDAVPIVDPNPDVDADPDGCNLTDCNGDLFEPDPTNIMSYNHKTCRTYFSPQQIERMRKTLVMGNSDLLEDLTDSNTCDDVCDARHTFNATYSRKKVMEFETSISILSSSVLHPDLLNADGTVAEHGAKITYDSGGFILLEPGFNAEYTSEFLAIIEGCGGLLKNSAPELGQNSTNTLAIYPNPFREQCTIVFDLVEDETVTIAVSDIMGKKLTTLVSNEQRVTGKHQINFDGSNFPPGIYYCSLQTGSRIETKKMVITK